MTPLTPTLLKKTHFRVTFYPPPSQNFYLQEHLTSDLEPRLRTLTSGKLEASGPSGASSTSMSDPSESSRVAPARGPGTRGGRGSAGCRGGGGVGG